MSKKSDTRKNVVVVGGGFAGVIAVTALGKSVDRTKYNIVLVTPRPYYVHLIATLRMVVSAEDKLEDTALIPYDKLLPGLEHVAASVTSIEETSSGKGGVLVLSNGERVEYAAVILATGSLWSGVPALGDTDEVVRQQISQWRARFAGAQNVVIVGGGAVGIELAGEVRESYPKKKVTIIHGDAQLLNDAYPEKFRRNMDRRVRALGIEVIENDYLDEFPEAGTTVDLRTRNGKVISSVDLVVPAFGAKPNTAVISTLDASVVTSKGFVKVKPTFEIQGHPGVFAIGDIIDWVEQKQAAKARGHAAIAAANVASFLNGAPLQSEYKGSPEMIVIPIGKYGGAAYLGLLWGIQLGGWFTRLVKGKALLVPAARKMLGYTS